MTMRIVSLLPGATEIVCALGLEESLVGVSHECDFPVSVQALPKVTRTLIPQNASSAQIDSMVRERVKARKPLYSLDVATLEELKPDLIVTQALCDVCAVAESEVKAVACKLPGHPKILNLEPMSLEDVFTTLIMVGKATACDDRAREVVRELRKRVAKVEERTATIPKDERPRVAFLEWIDPPFHGGHWTPSLIAMAGGVDVLGEPGKPSRNRKWREIVAAKPDVLFVACCGYKTERAEQDLPILYEQRGWDDLPCVRSGRIYVVDGSAYFNRPGPRLVDSLEILAEALHPES